MANYPGDVKTWNQEMATSWIDHLFAALVQVLMEAFRLGSRRREC